MRRLGGLLQGGGHARGYEQTNRVCMFDGLGGLVATLEEFNKCIQQGLHVPGAGWIGLTT